MNFTSSITLAFKDAFSSGFNDAKDSLAGMRGALDEISGNQSMNRLAADMAMMTSMTDPMRKALSEAMDQPSRIAGSLDTSFRTIQIGLGATNEEMEVTRRELLAIGGRAVAGPEAVAGAFANVATGVADASKHMAIMSAAVSLAEANQADLAMSTNALINVVNAWNLSAEDAAIAADIFTQASYMGVGSLDDFAGGISHISALASGAGIGLDELGASFAYVTTKGLDAGQAQKQFKGIISTLLSPSENLSKLYQSLGIESGKAMLQQYGLADSLAILKDALGGDEQAFANLIGSADAATVALALTEDAYVSFAGSFAEGMGTVTEAARSVQLESIEAKMARLDSVSRSLQAQVGQDINNIKGHFIDFKFGFLSNIVSPLMSSPVGGFLSKTTAFVGMAAKGVLDFGSGAMNAAAQMTTLAANISNAGGIAKMFHSGIGLAGSSLKILATPLRVAGSGLSAFSASVKSVGFLKTFQTGLTGIGQGFVGLGKGIVGALPKMGAWIASMWSAAAAHMAAFWPVYAVIGGVAALAAGVYLLIKHWDKVSGFFVGLWDNVKGAFSAAWDWIKNLIFGASDWVLVAVSIFFPFIGIPALIIKHWDSIKTFFVNLWNDPKATIMGFIDWIGSKVEAFVAPFKAIGDVVGGVFGKIGGFFKGIVGGGKDSGAALTDAFASGIQSNASAPGTAFGDSLQTVSRQMPHSDAQEGPLSGITASGRALTETFASGMDGTAIEQKSTAVFSQVLPSANQQVNFAGDTSPEQNAALSYTASTVDTSALSELVAQGNSLAESLSSRIGESDLREKASLAFPAAMPQKEQVIEIATGSESSTKSAGSQIITIQNLYLQAEDCESLLDFVRMIMHSVNRPEGVPV
jgi:TP901 family phage tail tape measure protein